MTIAETLTGIPSNTLTPSLAFGLILAGLIILLIGFIIGLVTDELY